jgi:hypothetical protein
MLAVFKYRRRPIGLAGWGSFDRPSAAQDDSYGIPNSAITSFMSFHTSFLADGVRSR